MNFLSNRFFEGIKQISICLIGKLIAKCFNAELERFASLAKYTSFVRNWKYALENQTLLKVFAFFVIWMIFLNKKSNFLFQKVFSVNEYLNIEINVCSNIRKTPLIEQNLFIKCTIEPFWIMIFFDVLESFSKEETADISLKSVFELQFQT